MSKIEYLSNEIKNIILSSGFDIVGIFKAHKLKDYEHLKNG